MRSVLYFGFILLVVLCVIGIVACIEETSELIPAREMSGRTGEAVQPQGAGPCDSVYYKPVTWGNPLITIPQTLTSGKRGSVSWWQVKLDAKNFIDPTKYKQGVPPNWERVVIADSILIMSNDTFYICRKIKL